MLRGIYIIRFLPAQKGSRYIPLSILVLTSKVLLLLMVLVLISNDKLKILYSGLKGILLIYANIGKLLSKIPSVLRDINIMFPRHNKNFGALLS